MEEITSSSDRRSQGRLTAEAEHLRQTIRSAQSVNVAEAEASCQKICAAAVKAKQGIAGHLVMPSVARLASQVQQITQEANLVAGLVDAAKQDLAFSQEWLSAKPNTKAADWLGGWSLFLEQLQNAISRVQLPAILPSQPKATPEPERVLLKDLTNSKCSEKEGDATANMGLPAPVKPAVMEPVTHQAQKQFQKPKKAVKLDDDERVEDLLARMASQGAAGAAGSLFGRSSPQVSKPETPVAAVQEPPKPRTRVPLIYDSKENAQFA